MKTKETLDSQTTHNEKNAPAPAPVKPKSLRPMRSMIALRSFKPRTTAAAFSQKQEQVEKH